MHLAGSVVEQMAVCSSNQIPSYPGLPIVQFDCLQHAKSKKMDGGKAWERGYLTHICKRESFPHKLNFPLPNMPWLTDIFFVFQWALSQQDYKAQL